ncbi:MAG: beta-hexosaminidase, partial [Gammaproteobacteria bacterium]
REPRGLLYGTVTLWELCTADGGHSGAINVPAMRISDTPRFAWRGLMLDSARHYQSPDFILELIDWMALHKLNVLHWHLTDDQGWRLEIQKYPRLTAVGAWRVPAGTAAAADIDP